MQQMAKEMRPDQRSLLTECMQTAFFIVAHKPDGEEVHDVPGQWCEAVLGKPLLGLSWQ